MVPVSSSTAARPRCDARVAPVTQQIEELAAFVASGDVGGCSGLRAAAHQARAARYVWRDPGRRRAARSSPAPRAAWLGQRRHGLRARFPFARPADRRAAERHRRTLDRTVRGAAARLGSGRHAGAASRVGSRRAGTELRPRHADGSAARLRRRRPARRRVHAAAPGPSERAGVAVGGGSRGGAPARPGCERDQPQRCASPRRCC